MSLVDFELHQAYKAIERFCVERSRTSSKPFLCRLEGNDILIWCSDDSNCSPAALRISYATGTWNLYWRRHNGTWEPYAHLRSSADIGEVIPHLTQAPLHVHWG